MTRILIADDHAIVRRGLANLLAGHEDFELVGEAGDGAQAVALTMELEPDVVLIDLSMPVLDGIEATARIVAERPQTRIGVLTSFAQPARIRSALDAGAHGYLLKDAEPDDLVAAIRLLAAGHSPLTDDAARALAQGDRTARIGTLTTRERTVLSLLARGCSNKEIGLRLGISEKTVKTHVTRVFRAIGVFDRVQAALWARDHGLGPVH
jgi:DNA-binding NarL/FixJ family response regulator